MSTRFLARAAFLLIGTFVCALAHASKPWTVIGAGNLTCKEWRTSGPGAQTEILSWMTGFISAVNISNASHGVGEFPLQVLTYDYLRHEVTLKCSGDNSANEDMVVVVFKVLKDLPIKRQP